MPRRNSEVPVINEASDDPRWEDYVSAVYYLCEGLVLRALDRVGEMARTEDPRCQATIADLANLIENEVMRLVAPADERVKRAVSDALRDIIAAQLGPYQGIPKGGQE